MPKRSLDTENKENEEIPVKKTKTTEIEQLESPLTDEEEEEEEEEDEPWPLAAVIENNEGTLHPSNNQYIVYENTEPSIVSKTARFWSRKYLKVLHHVNPDAYNMYIHNDFVCYGELEVLENCLLDMAKGMFLKRKNPISFIDCADSLSMIDDGERFEEIFRVVGACCVTILRDLFPKSMFNKEELNEDDMRKLGRISHQLPNLKEVLKRAIIIGYHNLTIGDTFSAFTNILQTVYCKWLLLMEKISIDLNEKPDEKDEELWQALKHAAAIGKNDYKESFNFLTELAHYSAHHPGLGGNSHDLRKWSKAQRHVYSFDNDDVDSLEKFWHQL